jgi:uncharacterized protein
VNGFVVGRDRWARRLLPGRAQRSRPALGWLALFCAFLLAPFAHAAETIPPAPRDHFNDYAGIVSAATARQLNDELTQFERTTSNQIVVAIFPHMQSDSSIEDYTVRVAQAWGVGQKDKKNGAVLFIFSQDRKLYIQVGYGLEGVLPDALCKQIIANEITPRFRNGDFTGGVASGTRAMLAAARGEYKGTGRTVADRNRRGKDDDNGFGLIASIIVITILVIIARASSRRQTIYGRRGRISPWLIAAALSNRSSGGWSSGGSSGGGGGSFSGGGGSFGGGGAGGSW